MAGVGNTTNPNPTSPASSLVTNTATAPVQTGTGQQLGATAFLSLLTTELKNQDPLNPMDDTQSVTQLAQFQALQSQVSLADSFTSFQSNFAVSQAAGLIGHTVAVNTGNMQTSASTANGSSISGKIAGIQIVNGKPEFAMTDSSGNVITDSNGNPALFAISQITAIVN
ncbi:MAG: hypothetical protein JO349_05870 [Candidatus Eremiobacteraeota bacterium]|nr:hypothetical protein [Candidatus Eremiobacteraeota bacterium]